MTYSNILNKGRYLAVVLCLLFLSYSALAQDEEPVVFIPEDTVFSDLDDVINMGFIAEKKRNVVGAVSYIKPQRYIKYDHTQSIGAAINNKVSGLKGSKYIRGIGEALIIVDGIPGRSIDILNTEEIESITVLKDANAIALYGAMARNGVIVIETKRGKNQQKGVNVTVNSGIYKPVLFPQYLGSAEYMEYYNQAFANDGLGGFYFDTTLVIPNYRDKTNLYKYPDVDFYSSEYVKPAASYTNVLTEYFGGNENSKYYINLGFNSSESILDFKDETGNYRFNIRGNVDIKINKWISSSIDAVAIIAKNKSAHGNYWGAANVFRPHLYAPLIPLSMINTDNPELKGIVDGANKYNNSILGINKNYSNNTPFGDAYAKGYINKTTRISQVNNSIDFDLSSIAEGLSAKTYLSFDFYNLYSESITNIFRYYEPYWTDNEVDSLVVVGDRDLKDIQEDISVNNFLIRYGYYGLINYEKQITENHGINATIIGYANSSYQKEARQPGKNSHIGLNLRYNYKNRLLADFSGAYINSVKLAEGNRGAFSPTIGLGYVVSDHLNLNWLDFLKVKASAGLIRNDIGMGYFLYMPVYESEGSSFNWGENRSNNYTRFTRGENLNLTTELRKDLSVGLEALFANKIWLEWNYYNTIYADLVTQLRSKFPSYYYAFMPYENGGALKASGFDLGANYSETFGDFTMDLGARLLYIVTKNLEVDEIWQNDFQYREGKPVDAYWGHTCLGFYGVDDFDENGELIEGIPVPAYNKVKPGDLRYLDKDENGIINDDDMHEIGRWFAPWSYGFDLTLNYKGFTIFALLSGENGADDIKGGSYYRPTGEDKYSEVVKRAWTPETANSATFPRLTTKTSTNTFNKTSTFWMYDRSYLSLQRVQLTYDLPVTFVKDFSVFVAGSNLALFAKNKKIIQTNPGGSPDYRYYTLGARINF